MSQSRGNGDLIEICWERCHENNCKRLLQRWVPIVAKYASVFGVKTIIDIPGKVQQPIPLGEKKSEIPILHLHLNSTPTEYSEKRVNNPSFFGIKIKDNVSVNICSIHSRQFYRGVAIPEGNIIICPEHYPVGFSNAGNLYIYKGVLGDPCWEDNQDLNILSSILYWSFASSVSIDRERLFSGYQLLQKKILRKKFNSKKGEASRRIISDFIKKGLLLNLEKAHSSVEDVTREIGIKRAAYFKKMNDIHEIEEALDLEINRNKAEDVGGDFEKIAQMDGVVSLRIEKDVSDIPYIMVRTNTLIQKPDDGRSYDIGAFEIKIYARPDKGGIHFSQNRRPGRYVHAHAVYNQTCFGNTSDKGLNNDIDRLMRRFDIAPLVHLILTFLQKESTTPRDSEEKGEHIPGSVQTTWTDGVRAVDKEEFIDFVSNQRLKNSTQALKTKLSDANGNLQCLGADREKLYLELGNLNESISKIEARIESENETVQEEFYKLFENNNIFWISGNEDELQICFSANSGFGEWSWGAKGCMLRINRHEPLEIFHGSRKSPTQSFILLSDKNQKLSPKMEKELHHLQMKGMIAQLVLSVTNLVRDDLFETDTP